jgi:sterol desaturase/sphingolipid hydroxylase (fatty acid hydroxylase superfamily)
MVYNYLYWLLIISVFSLILELILPWVKKVYLVREYSQDVFWLFFNGWVFGFLIRPLSEYISSAFLYAPIIGSLYSERYLLSGLSFIYQLILLLIAKDLIEYWVHRLLHANRWLWHVHKLHHSIKAMYWIGNFRFHWLEIIVYNTAKFIPLTMLGVHWKVIFACSVFSTLIGHLNHTNIKMDYGILKYILNSPSLHIWHHDRENHYRNGQNFAIVLSLWDWIFGTIYYKKYEYPEALGFAGDELYPGSVTKRFLCLS